MKCALKTGMVYNLSVKSLDGKVSTVENIVNEILDSSSEKIMMGFNTLPIPNLGSSVVAIHQSQTGVITPIPVSRSIILEGPVLINSETLENGQLFQWKQSFEYTYSGDGDTLREVGIPSFSRATISDLDDQIRAVELKSGDIVTLVTVFSLIVETSNGTMVVNNPFIENPPQTEIDYTINPVSDTVSDNWYLFFKNVTARFESGEADVAIATVYKSNSERQVTFILELPQTNPLESIDRIIMALGLSNEFITIELNESLDFVATQSPRFEISVSW